MEQSGWQVQIPFAPRLPASPAAEGRKLAFTARLDAAHQVQYGLPGLRLLTDREILSPVVLTLEKPESKEP